MAHLRPTQTALRLARRVANVLAASTAVLLAAAGALAAFGWPASRHPVVGAELGVARATRDLEAILVEPGPIEVETVVAADWAVHRGGLIDLEHQVARAAGLEDGLEPIHIYFHARRHPERGLFLVDTGIERALVHDPDHAVLGGAVGDALGARDIASRADTATWLAAQSAPLAGVLLTHLHVDHVLGLPDVPRGTPIYGGPGDTTARAAFHVVAQPLIDAALEGHGPIREWAFEPDPSGACAGVIDVLGDGALWAIAVPGHPPGSTACLARTPRGPVLLVGDACHTAWGWEHGVPPGTFTRDPGRGSESFERLRAFVARHPAIEVRLGHQPRPRPPCRAGAQRSRSVETPSGRPA